MPKMAMVSVALIAVVASGCYRATVDTGLVPSGQAVRKDWAHSFIGGLVPPATVETATRCPNGVARVETQLSFLNMLVGAITWGIYTPMSIHVQCAAARAGAAEAGSTLRVAHGASLHERVRVMNEAIEISRVTGLPVHVQFD
jgi:hypothetical protein